MVFWGNLDIFGSTRYTLQTILLTDMVLNALGKLGIPNLVYFLKIKKQRKCQEVIRSLV